MIGANTPAMIKAMTTEVESKNFIVASIHPYVESSRARLLPPQPCGPCLSLHLSRAHSLSHYTLDAMTGNGRHRGLVPTTRKKKAPPGTKSPRHQVFRDAVSRYLTAAGKPARRPAVFYAIVTGPE